MSYPAYSALLDVCATDKPQWLSTAIDSTLRQTVKPSEIIVVQNGSLTDELAETINRYKEENPELFIIQPLPSRTGLGATVRKGIEASSNGFVAYIDANGYSVPTRIEEEFEALLANKADIVGTNINEFSESIDNVTDYRTFPETPEEIYKFAKKKIPMAFSSVLFKKRRIQACRDYEDCGIAEDFALLIDLLYFRAKAYNIQKPLVYERHSKDNKFLCSKENAEAMRYFNTKYFKKGWFRRRDYLFRSTMNALALMMPRFVRNFVYSKVL